MILVSIAKIFAILVVVVVSLFGCKAIEKKIFILDGPDMVYVDREHRTEYANALPFDEHDGFPHWAVAYLGKGDEGENAAGEYIERLFAGLSREKRDAIEHYDYGGEKWYLVIPRHRDENDIVRGNDKENAVRIMSGEAFTINCGDDVKIYTYTHGGNELILQTDKNGRLTHADEVWDITEYKE